MIFIHRHQREYFVDFLSFEAFCLCKMPFFLFILGKVAFIDMFYNHGIGLFDSYLRRNYL
jgi:hypothetical protein